MSFLDRRRSPGKKRTNEHIWKCVLRIQNQNERKKICFVCSYRAPRAAMVAMRHACSCREGVEKDGLRAKREVMSVVHRAHPDVTRNLKKRGSRRRVRTEEKTRDVENVGGAAARRAAREPLLKINQRLRLAPRSASSLIARELAAPRRLHRVNERGQILRLIVLWRRYYGARIRGSHHPSGVPILAGTKEGDARDLREAKRRAQPRGECDGEHRFSREKKFEVAPLEVLRGARDGAICWAVRNHCNKGNRVDRVQTLVPPELRHAGVEVAGELRDAERAGEVRGDCVRD